MLCSTFSPLASSTSWSAYFTTRINFPSILKSPKPSRVYLVIFAVLIDTNEWQAASLCSSHSFFTLLMSAWCSNTLTSQSITYCNHRIAEKLCTVPWNMVCFRHTTYIANTQYKVVNNNRHNITVGPGVAYCLRCYAIRRSRDVTYFLPTLPWPWDRLSA